MRDGARSGPYRSRLRADSDFFFELQFCNEHGIPHSFFLGADLLHWEKTDREKAMAFVMEKNLRCQMCGTADWEWAENRYAYEPVTKTCWGCYLKESAAEGETRAPGMTYELRPTNDVAAAERLLAQKRAYLRRDG